MAQIRILKKAQGIIEKLDWKHLVFYLVIFSMLSCGIIGFLIGILVF